METDITETPNVVNPNNSKFNDSQKVYTGVDYENVGNVQIFEPSAGYNDASFIQDINQGGYDNQSAVTEEDTYCDFYGAAQVEFDPDFYDNPSAYENVDSYFYPDYYNYPMQSYNLSQDSLIAQTVPPRTSAGHHVAMRNNFSSIPEEPPSPSYDSSSANVASSSAAPQNIANISSTSKIVEPASQFDFKTPQSCAEVANCTIKTSGSTDSLGMYKSYIESVAKGLSLIDDDDDGCPETCILDDDDEEDNKAENNEQIYENISTIERKLNNALSSVSYAFAEEASNEYNQKIQDEIVSQERFHRDYDYHSERFVPPEIYEDGVRRFSDPKTSENMIDQSAIDYEEDPLRIIYDDFEPEIEALCEQIDEESDVTPTVNIVIESAPPEEDRDHDQLYSYLAHDQIENCQFQNHSYDLQQEVSRSIKGF